MIRELRYILAVLIGVSMMVSCVDEPIIQGSGDIPEGHATISAKVSFKPFGSALNGGSRTAGDAIKEIKSLYILLYDENEKLKEAFNAEEKNDQGGYIYNYTYEQEESREDVQPGDGEYIAEQNTPCATFKKAIPYGNYYIYAVANYALPENEEDYDTIDELLSLPLTWNSKDVSANNQMLGYFTSGKTNQKPNGWQSHSPVTIAAPSVNLHAWIRRAASKVTVAYDGSGLNEGIFIYLKSVTIKDIPEQCYLGKDNAPAKTERLGISNDLIKNGETIYYGGAKAEHTIADYEQWPRIAKGNPYYYYTDDGSDPETLDGAHTEKMNALFFYENMQGDFSKNENRNKYDKRQDGDGDKQLDEPGLSDETKLGWKDNVLKGSYIEVDAYYTNFSGINVSRGRIIYRFMLGKNTTYNYDAERNYHYMLTLKFKGNANDVDWHIDYKEDEGIYTPNVWYVSYLYDQMSMMPLKVVGDLQRTGDDRGHLYARIIQNDWFPYTRTTEDAGLVEYYRDSVYTSNGTSEAFADGNISEGASYQGQPWNGFLSLQSSEIYTGPEQNWGYNNADNTKNNYYYWQSNDIGTRYYEYPSSNTEYEVKKEGEDLYMFQIPLWTRQKNLITATGFTGNNVNVGNLRMARMYFSANIKKKDDSVEKFNDTINVIQVRRMVNPKAIYRKYNSTKPFTVRLMYQETQTSTNFVPLFSEGEWKAKIDKGANWIKLNGSLGGEVHGTTGSAVEFTYEPNKALTDSTDVNYGIIRVTYHNNSCTHLIMVRQGYAPLDVAGDGTQWCTFNMYDKDSFTQSPLEEGSLFKYANWDDAILASNNDRNGFKFGESIGEDSLNMASGQKKWEDISPGTSFSDYGDYTVPTLEQWNNLKDLEFGVGVVYADGATETATTLEKAYGYNLTDGTPSEYGMRGYVIYNPSDGKNVFFPIGKSGYGRRKQASSKTDYVENAGTLRYANRSVLYRNDIRESNNLRQIGYRPMFWNIYKSEGAIYWLQSATDTEGKKHTAWDMNYYTLDFSPFYENAYGEGDTDSDACFIRLVVKE